MTELGASNGTSAPASAPMHVTVRALRRDRSIAPGGPEFTRLARSFLPLVYGTASLMLPSVGDASAASLTAVVAAVFQCFAHRWRRLPRRTVVATWLVRATGVAARLEGGRLGLAPPSRASPTGVGAAFLRALFRLRRPQPDLLLLRCALRVPLAEAARAVGRGERRAGDATERGLAKLGRRLRRTAPGVDARTLLAGLAVPVPEEIEQTALAQIEVWSPRDRPSERVRAIRRAWRWMELRRAGWRAGVGFATGFVCLAVALVTVVSLFRLGYLMPWLMGQSSRRLAKEMPEVARPARPWPPASEGASPSGPGPPRTSAELYALTNIWTVRLSFTADQWRAIAPTRVPPVPNMMGADGTIILRNPKARRSGLAGAVGLEFNWVRARLEFAGHSLSPVAVRYRGNGTYLNSLFGPKQSLKVDLDRFAKGQSLGGVRTLNLVNSIPDSSYLHDTLAQELFRALGVPGPRTGYAYVSRDIPGGGGPQPLGLFVLIENVDAEFAADRFGSRDVPIFKPVTTELFKYLGDDWAAYADIYDLKTKATPQQIDQVVEFARLVTVADDAEFARRVGDFLDLEGFAGFLAGHVLLASYDGFLSNGQNFYMYFDPRSRRFGFIPWDQDHSWGEFGYVASAERRERASIWQPSTYRNRFLERVLKVEAFRAIYRRHLEQALAGPFTVERLFPRIDQLGALIRPAVAAESEFRLERFEQAISTNWVVGPREGPPEGPRAPVHQLKRFIVRRIESVRDQLEGRAEGEVLAAFGSRGN